MLCLLFLNLFFLKTANAEICCKCTNQEDPKSTICIKFLAADKDCPLLPGKSTNPQVKKLTCTESLNTNTSCKAVAGGGLCIQGPTDETVYSTATTSGSVLGTKTVEPVAAPKLGIQIPGLQFATQLIVQEGYLEIPFLSQYISAVYNYMVGIVAIVAAIMIVYGGFLYIVGSSGAKVQQGKTIIVDAVMGLLLVLGAYIILSTINPDLINFQPQRVAFIEPIYTKVPEIEYSALLNTAAKSSGYTPNPQIAGAFKKHPGGTLVSKPTPGSTVDQRISVASNDLKQIIKDIGTVVNLDPCVIEAIIMTETGGNPALIGHDENSGRARAKFLKSGVKYSGATFGPSDLKVYNDDKKVTAVPPNYGLDWRFSHGIGLGQCTIFPKGGVPNYCEGQDKSPGIKYGTKCFTVPIAMTMEGSIECMVELLKIKQKEISGIGYLKAISSPCNIFCYWLGTCKKDPTCMDPKFAGKKMKVYNDCKKR